MRESGRRYRITFVPDPVCWTEAPESLSVLRRQRNRWQRGLAEILWFHRSMVGRGRYGLVGLVRRHWRGFSGGAELWRQVEAFFTDLRARARPLGAGA